MSWPSWRPGLSKMTPKRWPTVARLNACRCSSRSAMQAREPLRLDLRRGPGRPPRPPACRGGRIFEREGGGESDLAHERERRLEIGVGLAGEADDEVGGEGDVGARAAHALDDVEIVAPRVAAVHRGQDAVGARLHRQMQIGRERRVLGVGGDQLLVHVVGVRGRIAQAQHAGDFAAAASSAGEVAGRRRRRAVIGVDVLPDQGEFARARPRRGVSISPSTWPTGRETSAPRV